MVDKELKKVFDKIDNRTDEEQKVMDAEFKQKQIEQNIINLRNECYGLILERKEDYCSERLVEAIESKYKIYTTRDDKVPEMWIYNGGIYEPNGESFIEEFVREILLHIATPQRVNKVVFKIGADTKINPNEFFNTMYLDEICVENGILNLKTRKLSPFTPEKIFFNKIPVKFDTNCKCPSIDKFFGDVLRDEGDKDVLYELTGFCLHKEYFAEKAFMFVGSGRNGKGKTLGLLKKFLGVENSCSITLNEMTSGSTSLCELHNRLVCLAGDLDNSSLKTTGFFKMLTGRDTIQVKRKYLRDLIFVNYAKIVFACNELPRVYDMSLGFWSRWVLLEFPYEFLPEDEIIEKGVSEFRKIQDDKILEKISTPDEMSGLLNLAIDGLDRLKEKGDFSYSKGTASVKDFWVRASDSFRAFCMDKIEENFEEHISKKNLRKSFSQYCKEHGVKGCSDKNIKAVLEDMFGVIEMRRDGGDSFDRVWEGIKFKGGNVQKIPTIHHIHHVSTTLEKSNSSTLQNPMDMVDSRQSQHINSPKKEEKSPKEEKIIQENQNLNKQGGQNEKDRNNQSN